MLDLGKTIASLARNRDSWEKLMGGANRIQKDVVAPATRLQEIHGFGSNPGSLRMFNYVPSRLAASPALVVVLHGCTQSAAGYDHGAGWCTLAGRYGFALLAPEQQRSNNPHGCFSWFHTGDIERDRGEALSIRQMIESAVIENGIDRRRVFITGLSAGGAMTSVMLACYPEVFAGGAIIAGLPYGSARNVQEALESMAQSPARSAREWGDLVRGAARHDGPWPRISVWHGNADKTVIPSNAREILKQWTEIHGLPMTPSKQERVDGHPRQIWLNEAGDEVIESYAITGMAHGTPLSTGEADGACGAAGPFLLDVGISSSYHIARFFGLATAAASATSETVTDPPDPPRVANPAAAPAQADRLEGLGVKREGVPIPPARPFDIGAAITKALKAAGLMKDG